MDLLIKQHDHSMSAAQDASGLVYRKLVGSRGTWMVAMREACAQNIYFCPTGGSNLGFGGAVLSFTLEDGTIEHHKGPWHSNSDALFEDTGYDVRDKHETFVVVSEGREYLPNQGWNMLNILYKDEQPEIGRFKRGEEIAQRFANELDKQVFLYCVTPGGSSCGSVKPDHTKGEGCD